MQETDSFVPCIAIAQHWCVFTQSARFAMSTNSLTSEELQRRYEAAQARRKRAAEAERRLRHKLVVVDRRLAATQKIVLGAALLRAAEQYPQHVDSLRKMILQFITRDGDKACLDGTPFAFPASAAADEKASA